MDISLHSCRVCLKNPILLGENWENQMKSIEDTDENSSFTFAEKFTMCTGIQISNDILYARNICLGCLSSLKDSFSFLVTCKKSEIILRNYINNYVNNESSQPKVVFEIPTLNEIATDLITQEIKMENKNQNIEFLSVHKLETYLSDGSEIVENETDHLTTDILISYDDIASKRTEKIRKTKSVNIISDSIESAEKNKHKRPKKPPKPRKPPKEPETPVICDICGNFYKDRKQLEYHRHLHTGEKSFKCSICDRGFALRSYLTGHMLTHTGVRKFQCNFCDKKFYRACVMRLHEKKHNLQRDYECKICNKKFKLSNYLKRHMRIHNDERPYSCKLCSVSFRRDHHLKQHIKTRAHRELLTKPTEQRNFEPTSQSTQENLEIATVATVFRQSDRNDQY